MGSFQGWRIVGLKHSGFYERPTKKADASLCRLGGGKLECQKICGGFPVTRSLRHAHEVHAGDTAACAWRTLRKSNHPGGDGLMSHFIYQNECAGRAGGVVGIHGQRLLHVNGHPGDVIQVQTRGGL